MAATTSDDASFVHDKAAIESASRAKPWLSDPNYFRRVRVSALAAVKMLQHAVEGVRVGKDRGGMPLEIMGLMAGHIDTSDERTLIIHDCFPLPVEGTETRVMADDPEVMNYMIKLNDKFLEKTRNERFCGWYHSHPFDVSLHPNWFLSATDVSTQLLWQNMEDRAGNPWLAIVVDPLRSIAKSRPEIGAFRAYPPEYTAPAGSTPDGKILDKSACDERWGACADRYHCLKVEYFMSSLSSSMLSILSRSFLWTTVFASTPMLERENRTGMAERIISLSDKLGAARLDRRSAAGDDSSGVLSKPTDEASDLAVEHLRGQAMQVIKASLFADTGTAAAAGGAGGGAAGSGAGAGDADME